MKPTRRLTSTFSYLLDTSATLFSKSPSGAHREPLRRLARGVAFALVGLLCLAVNATPTGSNAATKTIFIDDKTSITTYVKGVTTQEQYDCFYDLAYRESRWNFSAKNGSHYGFMQGRSDFLRTATPMQQLLWSVDYVAVRYGVTDKDEPNWCKALDHLKSKGWH